MINKYLFNCNKIGQFMGKDTFKCMPFSRKRDIQYMCVCETESDYEFQIPRIKIEAR